MILFVTAKNSDRSSLFNIIFNPQSPSLFTRIFGLSPSKDVAFAEFFTTYAISIISAALGLAKCLKNGVARPIAPGGTLDGLLTMKFLFAILASAGVLVLRGLCIEFTVRYFRGPPSWYNFHLALNILLSFLPQFLLALFSTLNFRDKSSLKILYRQPSLIILPTVTFFTFSKVGLCNRDSRVIFSKKFTWLNVAVSTIGFVVWRASLDWRDTSVLSFLLVPSFILTALFIHLDCYCCCCCNSREQLSVYDPSLDKRFIMVDGEVVEDPEDDVETPEDDVETVNKTFCGCFNFNTTGEDTEPVLIAFTVRNETNVNASLANTEDDQHPQLPTVDDDLPCDASETIRQSAKIVSDALNNLIADIVTYLLIIVKLFE